jgi:DME family drug/metabolite transporter
MESNRGLGVGLVLMAAALWGTTGTAQSFASPELASGWFGALRLVVAGAFFAVYAAIVDRNGTSRSAIPLAPLLGAGACMAVYNLAFFAGIRDTGIAVGTAVALGSGPLWAGLLESLLTRRIPARAWWWGTLVAVGGGILLTLPPGRQVSTVGVSGILLCLLSGLSYAAYTLINKRLVRVASPASITLRVFSVAALVAVPVAWLDTGAPVLSARDALPIAYVGVVTAGVAYLLFSHALRHISAATGVTLALGEPATAFVLAIVVVGEAASAASLVGLIGVIAGVALVVRAELRASAPADASLPRGLGENPLGPTGRTPT